METVQLYREKLKDAEFIHSDLRPLPQVLPVTRCCCFLCNLITDLLVKFLLINKSGDGLDFIRCFKYCPSVFPSLFLLSVWHHLQPSDSSWNQLSITIQRCSDLQSRTSQQPSPYVFYKFFNFPDYPTSTVNDRCNPEFNDLKSYSVPMDLALDRYLRSAVLQFYVFDYKEEQSDTYLGKARVPLLPLTQDQVVSGKLNWFIRTSETGPHQLLVFYFFSSQTCKFFMWEVRNQWKMLQTGSSINSDSMGPQVCLSWLILQDSLPAALK